MSSEMSSCVSIQKESEYYIDPNRSALGRDLTKRDSSGDEETSDEDSSSNDEDGEEEYIMAHWRINNIADDEVYINPAEGNTLIGQSLQSCSNYPVEYHNSPLKGYASGVNISTSKSTVFGQDDPIETNNRDSDDASLSFHWSRISLSSSNSNSIRSMDNGDPVYESDYSVSENDGIPFVSNDTEENQLVMKNKKSESGFGIEDDESGLSYSNHSMDDSSGIDESINGRNNPIKENKSQLIDNSLSFNWSGISLSSSNPSSIRSIVIDNGDPMVESDYSIFHGNEESFAANDELTVENEITKQGFGIMKDESHIDVYSVDSTQPCSNQSVGQLSDSSLESYSCQSEFIADNPTERLNRLSDYRNNDSRSLRWLEISLPSSNSNSIRSINNGEPIHESNYSIDQVDGGAHVSSDAVKDEVKMDREVENSDFNFQQKRGINSHHGESHPLLNKVKSTNDRVKEITDSNVEMLKRNATSRCSRILAEKGDLLYENELRIQSKADSTIKKLFFGTSAVVGLALGYSFLWN